MLPGLRLRMKGPRGEIMMDLAYLWDREMVKTAAVASAPDWSTVERVELLDINGDPIARLLAVPVRDGGTRFEFETYADGFIRRVVIGDA